MSDQSVYIAFSSAAVVFAGSSLPSTTVVETSRASAFYDVRDGGVGNIVGTVAVKGTVSNSPLRRKVLLINESSRMVVRETWSDALTGTYEFRGVNASAKYTVLAFDYQRAYRAAVADNLIVTTL